MKKIIIILLLAVAFSIQTKAQSRKVKSPQGDSVLVPNAARLVVPIPVSIFKDTVRSITWILQQVPRDSTAGSQIIIAYFNKKGNQIYTNTAYVPGSLYTNWTKLINLIDTSITVLNPAIVVQ